jgi:hypothetical protein
MGRVMADKNSQPDSKPPPANSGGPALRDDGGVPVGLTNGAIAAGLALIAIGVGIMAFASARLFNAGSLAMCIGFGLVLAAFGTRAAGTWQTWSVAGSGGIAIVLFLLLQALPSTQSDTPLFVRGNLHGTNDANSVRMFAAQFLLVGRSSPSEHFRFIAFPEDLDSKSFYVFIVDDKDPTMHENYIGCISVDLLKSRMKSGGSINLTVQKDSEKKLYRLKDNLDDKEYGEFGSPNCREQRGNHPKAARTRPSTQFATNDAASWFGSMFSIQARAGKMPKAKSPGVSQLIQDLESDSTDVRASARDDLGDRTDASSLALMTSTWEIQKSSYRADLGRLVAWTNAIRDNRDAAPLIAGALSPDQLAYVVQLTGHPDKTMRYNATEVLSWMLQSTGWATAPAPDKSKAIVDEIVNVFSGPKSIKITKPGTDFDFSNTAFNTLVALDDAKCVLNADTRQSISTVLAPFEMKYAKDLGKTIALSKDVRASLAKPDC